MVQDNIEDAEARAGLAEDLGIEEDPAELVDLEKQEAAALAANAKGGVKRLRNGVPK